MLKVRAEAGAKKLGPASQLFMKALIILYIRTK
jgi:hypothetical protein